MKLLRVSFNNFSAPGCRVYVGLILFTATQLGDCQQLGCKNRTLHAGIELLRPVKH